MLDFEHRYSGECRNPVKQRVAKGDTLLDWIPGQARYDDWKFGTPIKFRSSINLWLSQIGYSEDVLDY